VHIQVRDQRFRVWAGSNRLGSWPLEQLLVERVTPFRFRVLIDGDAVIVTPDDPAAFAEATNAFVDARAHRFGLAERIRNHRQANEPQAPLTRRSNSSPTP